MNATLWKSVTTNSRSRYRAMQVLKTRKWGLAVRCDDCGWECGAETTDHAKALFREHRQRLH